MLKNHRLFSINIKIWKFLGFIDFKSYWKCSAFLFIPIITAIYGVTFLIISWGQVDILILNSFMTAVLLNSIFRIMWVVLNQKDYMIFMNEVVDQFNEMEDWNDSFAKKVLQSVVSKSDKVSKFTAFLGVISSIATAVSSLFIRKDLAYPIWIPGIDAYESPYYEIIFAIQFVFVFNFIIAGYALSTNLFITWLLFGAGTLKILQNRFENVMKPPKTEEQIEVELDYCIQFHHKVVRYSERLNDMLSFTNLIEFLLFTVMLCVLLFLIIIVDNFMLQLNAFIFIVAIFYVVLLYYWFANELSCESLKIADAAYSMDWTNGSRKLKKSLLIIISRSHIALEMSIGGMYPMRLQSFQSLLNASYTYFTILREMQQ